MPVGGSTLDFTFRRPGGMQNPPALTSSASAGGFFCLIVFFNKLLHGGLCLRGVGPVFPTAFIAGGFFAHAGSRIANILGKPEFGNSTVIDTENASLLINFCFPAERVPVNGYISLLPHCLYLIILRRGRGHAHPDQPVLAIMVALPLSAERFKCGNHAVVADLRLGRQPLSVIVLLDTAGSNVHLGIRPGVCPLVIQPFGQTLEGSANIGNFHGLLLYHS